MSIKLYKSTIEDRVNKLAVNYDGDAHEAFLRLVFYLVTGKGYDDLEPEDLVDGAGEYQIDSLHIDDSSAENQATVTLIQATFADSLSSTKLVKIHAGLDYLVQQPKSAYSALMNKSLARKIQEFRDLRAEILPSNIRLRCYYASLGDPAKAVGEFPEQLKRILADYQRAVGEFVFEVLGPLELFELLDRKERKGAKVNEKLKVVYDRNKASLLEHFIDGVSGVICTVPAEEIARIVNAHHTVFDENLRQFLGLTGIVNQGIHETCVSQKDAPRFWFLNNGVTVVCDSYEVNKDFDNPFVTVTNMQIVNGCQTSVTLAKAAQEGHLKPSTMVMVRIFKTGSPDVVSKLVVTTNTQNKITARDLRANDPIQEHIQLAFAQKFSLLYERKPNEFASRGPTEQKLVVSNQKIGQAYLGIVRRKPSDARRRLYKVWGEEYAQLFNPSVYPETYLLVYRVVEACAKRKRALFASSKEDDLRRTILANGLYHVARAASFLWRGGDDWNDLARIQQDMQKLADEPSILDGRFDDAFRLVLAMVRQNQKFAQDVTTGLKSARLDEEIDKALYLRLAKAGRVKRRTSHRRTESKKSSKRVKPAA